MNAHAHVVPGAPAVSSPEHSALAFSSARYTTAPGSIFPAISIRVADQHSASITAIAVEPPPGVRWAADRSRRRRELRVVDGRVILGGPDALVSSTVPGRYRLVAGAVGGPALDDPAASGPELSVPMNASTMLEARSNVACSTTGGKVWGFESSTVSGTGTSPLRMIDEGHAVPPAVYQRFGALRKIVFSASAGQQPSTMISFALYADSTVRELGRSRPGSDPTAPRVIDVSARGSSPLVDVVVGGATAYGLTADGRVLAWGSSAHGALGNGSTRNAVDSAVEVRFPAGTFVIQIAAHVHPSPGFATGGGYALDSSGRVWAWGYGKGGAIGDGSRSARSVPVPVIDRGAVSIRGNESSGAALLSDGRVVNWGVAAATSQGGGSARDAYLLRPTIVTTAADGPLKGVTRLLGLGPSGRTFGALLQDGTFWAWGDDHGLRTRHANARPEYRATPWALANTLPDGVTVADWMGYASSSRVVIVLGTDRRVYTHLATSTTSSLVLTSTAEPLTTDALWSASFGIFSVA